jgi:hypothetical protein
MTMSPQMMSDSSHVDTRSTKTVWINGFKLAGTIVPLAVRRSVLSELKSWVCLIFLYHVAAWQGVNTDDGSGYPPEPTPAPAPA